MTDCTQPMSGISLGRGTHNGQMWWQIYYDDTPLPPVLNLLYLRGCWDALTKAQKTALAHTDRPMHPIVRTNLRRALLIDDNGVTEFGTAVLWATEGKR